MGDLRGGGGGAEMLPEHRGENLKYLTSKNIKHLDKTLKPLTHLTTNYSQLKTLLTLSRPCRYRTTTDLCLLM